MSVVSLEVPPPFPPPQTHEWVNAAYLGTPLNSLDSVQVTRKQAGKRARTSATSPRSPHASTC